MLCKIGRDLLSIDFELQYSPHPARPILPVKFDLFTDANNADFFGVQLKIITSFFRPRLA